MRMIGRWRCTDDVRSMSEHGRYTAQYQHQRVDENVLHACGQYGSA